MEVEPTYRHRRIAPKSNGPKVFAIIAGLIGILVAHNADLPEPYRKPVELISEAVTVIGAVLYDRKR